MHLSNLKHVFQVCFPIKPLDTWRVSPLLFLPLTYTTFGLYGNWSSWRGKSLCALFRHTVGCQFLLVQTWLKFSILILNLAKYSHKMLGSLINESFLKNFGSTVEALYRTQFFFFGMYLVLLISNANFPEHFLGLNF